MSYYILSLYYSYIIHILFIHIICCLSITVTCVCIHIYTYTSYYIDFYILYDYTGEWKGSELLPLRIMMIDIKRTA